MAEELTIKGATKEEVYESLIPQIEGLTYDEPDRIANMANIMAAIQQTFDFLWVGVYRVIDNELVLGAFQGPIACTRIKKGKGVCGSSWEKEMTLIVDDVEKFPGHIACSSSSKSEIVVPIFKGEEVIGVLDIDSEALAHFNETDQKYLEQIAKIIAEKAF